MKPTRKNLALIGLLMILVGSVGTYLFVSQPVPPNGHIKVLSAVEQDTVRYVNLTSNQIMTKTFTGNLTLDSLGFNFVWQYNGPGSPLPWYYYVELGIDMVAIFGGVILLILACLV